ncbi:uncharacterized protein LOC125836058 [Solanum verrucosum]|uniref:uncharacterized protein LOC125836058 n=1 Tax=Solanum verrucosum TaxID=315347 RepID=UPI0020D0B04C|nr:uncharacterized protein LOC125836058 [Solanum verrucosum]
MPPRRAGRGRPARRNVEEKGVPNAREVQPQGEVTNAEFREAIRMLSQFVTNQVGQQRGARHEVTDTSRIREFLRMNPPSFTGSRTTNDPENFWKKGRAEGAPPGSWVCFKEGFLWRFFPRELREAKVREFLTLKQDSLSFHEYSLKFTQLSRYAPKMVADMRSRMSLFVAGLSHLSSKEGKHFRARPAQCQGSVAQEGNWDPCPKNRQGNGNQGNKAQSSLVAPPDRAAPKGSTSGTGRGAICLYAITSRQE